MERGLSLYIVSTVISHSTPTCVSKELAERCSGFVTTLIMQFSWKMAEAAEGLVGLCSLCSWRAMSEKFLMSYWLMDMIEAKLLLYCAHKEGINFGPLQPLSWKQSTLQFFERWTALIQCWRGYASSGLYYLKRNVENHAESSNNNGQEYFSSWKRHAGVHFLGIVLSSKLKIRPE
ncbi:hypothetical protein J1N35_021184 [Gossypium stocksii]|uniref:Uncharacterized protein n=1 Tax=Gossypium stocksii TaxID=47602 RepID=A0A9D3VEE1_9ROSI|nr:hypothetical protein J1N35_021184 [Gossypium stocksii]